MTEGEPIYFTILREAQRHFDAGRLVDAGHALIHAADTMEGHPAQGQVRHWAFDVFHRARTGRRLPPPVEGADLAIMEAEGQA